ncbi:MAG: hypothetical protein ACD_75C00055G0008 [uncultured bacterium]|nr:MAG: hypothetical protein ACD_75C00055G0008 [uncultured bacterium]
MPIVEKIKESLVDEKIAFGAIPHEGEQAVPVDDSSRRIIGSGDDYQVIGADAGHKLMAIHRKILHFIKRHGYHRKSRQPRGPDIIDIRGNRNDRAFGRQDSGNEIEQFGGTVAGNDPVDGDPGMFGNCLEKLGVFRIGVVHKVFKLTADQRPKPLRRAQWIDIGAEVEDFVEDFPRIPCRFPEGLMDIAAMFEGLHMNQSVTVIMKIKEKLR